MSSVMRRLKAWFKEMKEKRSERIRNMTGIQGYSKRYSISARVESHFCLNCHALLDVVKKEKIVNSESEEAKDFDFSSDEGRRIGNIKFIYDVFHCAKCDSEYSIRDVRRVSAGRLKPRI